MGPLSIPALGAPCQIWGQQGWRCLLEVLPWSPPRSCSPCSSCMALSICLSIFSPPKLQEEGRSLQHSTAPSPGTKGVALCPQGSATPL